MAAQRKLSEVVAEGDLRASLEALRDTLAAEIEAGTACVKCGGSVSSPTASLAKQLADVLVGLEALPRREASAVDQLAKRRAARLSGAKVSDGSGSKPAVKRGGGGGRARN